MSDTTVVPLQAPQAPTAPAAGTAHMASVSAAVDGGATAVIVFGENAERLVEGHLDSVPALHSGERVCVFLTANGGAIVAGRMREAAEAPMAMLREESGHLHVSAQQSITLSTGACRIELSADGRLRVDGREIQQVAERRLGLVAATVELN